MNKKIWTRVFVEMAIQKNETFQADLIHNIGCGWLCCGLCCHKYGEKGHREGSPTINPTSSSSTVVTTAGVTPTKKYRTHIFNQMKKDQISTSADAIFHIIDDDHSGLIEFTEFKRGIRMIDSVRVQTTKPVLTTDHSLPSSSIIATSKCRCWHWNCVDDVQLLLRKIFTFELSTLLLSVQFLCCGKRPAMNDDCFNRIDTDDSGELDKEECCQALGELLPYSDQVIHNLVELNWMKWDVNGDDSIDKKDFNEIVRFVTTELHHAEEHHHAGHRSLLVADLIVDLVVCLSCVSIYFKTLELAAIDGHQNHFAVWNNIGNIALALFVVEIILRMYAFGIKEYVSAPMHVSLDLFFSVLFYSFLFFFVLFCSFCLKYAEKKKSLSHKLKHNWCTTWL